MDESSEDNDFSDLYADVEVQASSAISAMHGKTEMETEKNAVSNSINAFDSRAQWSRGDGVDDLKPRPCYVPFSNNLEVCASAKADLEGNERDQLIDQVPVANQSVSDFSHRRDSRHTRESDPTSLDFLNSGLLHSDSDEDEQRQVIESNSDELEGVIAVSNDTNERNESSTPEQEPSTGESESDSDESEGVIRTSNDANKRSESSMPEQEPSTGEPESSKSGQNQCSHGLSCSPSPYGTVSNDDTRSYKRSKLTSVSLDLETWEMVNKGYRFSHRSDTHFVNANTRGIRCDNKDRGYAQRRHEYSRKSPGVSDCEFRESPVFDRQLSKYSDSRGSLRKEEKMRRTSNLASNTRAHQRDSDAYDAMVKKNVSDDHFRIDHEKKREIPISNSGRRNRLQFKRSENSSHYFYGFAPDDDRWSMYSKEQVRDAYPNVEHGGRLIDDYHHGERKFLNEKTNMADYGYYEDDWCNNRRHSDRDTNHLNIAGCSRKWTSNFSHDLNGRSTTGNKKEDGMQFRRRREGDDLSPYPGYGTDFIEGKHNRFALHGGSEEIDRFNLVDDRVTFRDGRELESPRRVKRKYNSHFNGFDGAFCIKNEQSNRRYMKPWARAMSSDEDRQVPRRGPFQRATAQDVNVSEGPALNAKFSWKDRLGELSQHGFNDAYFENKECLMHHYTKDHVAPRSHNQQSSRLFNSNERITDHNYQDHFDKKPYHLLPGVLNHNLTEEDYRSRYLENNTKFQSGGSSYFEEISRSRRPEYVRTSDRVGEVINRRMAGRCTHKLRRDDEIDYEFGRICDSIHPDNCTELFPRYRGSGYPHIAIKDQESCRRTSEAGDAMNYMGKDVYQEPKRLKESKDRKSVFAVGKKIDTNQSDKCGCDNDIEEGQIVSEETSEKQVESVIAQSNDVVRPRLLSRIDRVVEGFDDQRIQEIMKKMEKRRERFKEPLNRDSEKTSEIFLLHVVDSKASEDKTVRPSRKRRWI